MFICERCGQEHDGSYGSGRFCSSYCASTRFPIKQYVVSHNEVVRQTKYDNYFVTDFGNVIRKVGKIYVLAHTHVYGGYRHASIICNGKHFEASMHRLLMMTFFPIDNPEEMQVNHKDENKLNDRLDNLEWCTPSYNVNYGTGKQRMIEKQSIPVIDLVDGTVYSSLSEASRKTNTPLQNISACCHNRLKTANGHKFAFYDK